MKFRRFFHLTEQDAAGGMPSMGAPPGAGMAGPAAGPMGAPPDPMAAGGAMGAMGAPPGMPGMPGMGGGSAPAPVIPKHADVWEVLDSLVNKKPVKDDRKQNKQALGNNPPVEGGAGAAPGAMGGPMG